MMWYFSLRQRLLLLFDGLNFFPLSMIFQFKVYLFPSSFNKYESLQESKYASLQFDQNCDQTLKVGSLEHLEQIPIVRVTFVPAIFVLATFVHIRNNSVVTDLILTKL